MVTPLLRSSVVSVFRSWVKAKDAFLRKKAFSLGGLLAPVRIICGS